MFIKFITPNSHAPTFTVVIGAVDVPAAAPLPVPVASGVVDCTTLNNEVASPMKSGVVGSVAVTDIAWVPLGGFGSNQILLSLPPSVVRFCLPMAFVMVMPL